MPDTLLGNKVLYEEIIKNAADGILIADTKTQRFIYANTAICKMLGYSKKELLKLSVHKIHPKKDLPYVLKKFKDQARGKISLAKDLPVRKKNKQVIYCDINSKPLVVGKNTLMIGFFRDTTRRKKLEKELKESEETLRDLFDNANDIIQSVGKNGDFVYVNKLWYELLEYTPKELQKLKVWDIVDKSELAHCRSLFMQLVNGTPSVQAKTIFITKKGKRIFVEGNINAWIKDGQFFATRGIFRDITGQKAAEKALADSEARYRALFATSRDAIMTLEPPTWKFTSGNKASVEMFKCKNEKEFTSFAPPQLSPPVQPDGQRSDVKAKAMIMKAMKKGSNFFEWTHRTKDGKDFPATVLLTRAELEKGKPFLQATVRDITENKNILNKLRSSEMLYSRLVNNLPGVVYKGAPDWSVPFISRSISSILGYSSRDIIDGKIDFPSLIHPEDKEKVSKESAVLAKKPVSIIQTYRVKNKANNYLWIRDHKTSLFADNKYAGVIGTFFDITKEKNAEEKLRTSEEKYRSLVENASDMIFMIDRNYKYLSINKALADQLGEKQEDVVGLPVKKFFPAQAYRRLKNTLGILFKTGQTIALEEAMPLPGKLIWAANQFSPIKDARGKVIAVMAISRDITYRKKIEEELKESETKFRELTDLLPEIIFETNASNQMTYANRSWFEKWGYSPEDLKKGITPMDLVVPEDREKIGEVIQALIKGKKIGAFECLAVTKSGEKRASVVHPAPFFKDGKFAGLRGIVFDISHMKAAEEALLLSEAKWRSWVEYAPNIIINIDRSGSIQYINHVISGFKLEDIIGRSQYDFIEPEYRDIARKAIEQVFQTGRPGYYEVKGAGPDKRPVWYATGVGPIKAGTEVVSANLFVSDITKLKEAEDILKRDKESLEELAAEKAAELFEAEKDLKQAKKLADIGTLASTVAHEIRNPLGVIRAATYNIRRKSKGDLLTKHLDNIDKKILESSNIIDNLLIYSRIKLPQFEELNLFELLQELIGALPALFPKYKIDLKQDIDILKTRTLEGDPLQLKQVFTNILNNACQALPERTGSLEISAKLTNKNNISIAIKDSGIGIAREDLGKIFQPFYTKKAKGTGLGLAITNELVAMHNGNIDIKSDPGQGSIFTTTLPLRRKAK